MGGFYAFFEQISIFLHRLASLLKILRHHVTDARKRLVTFCHVHLSRIKETGGDPNPGVSGFAPGWDRPKQSIRRPAHKKY